MNENRIIFGNHTITDDTDGYTYSRNTTESYDFDTHTHKCCEFVHIISGELLYTVENNTYRLTPGDMVFTIPDEFHSFEFPEKCEYSREFLHIYPMFFKDFPKVQYLLDNKPLGEKNCIPAELVKKYGIDRIFDDIFSYADTPVSERDFMILTYALQLTIKTFAALSDEKAGKRRVTPNTPAQVIQQYINREYTKNISPESAARYVYMSKIQADREFKKEMGTTIHTYICLRRINRAKSLIMQGEKATRIYGQCGFEDYSTFYRTFLKVAGMTPSEFKKQQQNKGIIKE